MLEQIEALLESGEESSSPSALTDAQKEELEARRQNHIKGNSKSYSWDAVKQELIDKYGLPA